MAKSTFGREFAKARKAQGAGGTFVWLKSEGGNGETYSTNIAGETGKKSSKDFSVDMAKKAIDKSAGVQKPTKNTPRPMARPVDKTPTPVAAPVKISVTPLTKTVNNLSARPEGKAAGMPGKKKETPAEREKRIATNTPLGKIIASFSGPYTRVPAKSKVSPITPTLSRKDAIEAAMKKRNK